MTVSSGNSLSLRGESQTEMPERPKSLVYVPRRPEELSDTNRCGSWNKDGWDNLLLDDDHFHRIISSSSADLEAHM